MPNVDNNYLSYSDGHNFYLTLYATSKAIGRRILGAACVILLAVWVFLVLQYKASDGFGILVAYVAIFVFIVVLPVKTLLWNTFGKEIITITPKVIASQFDYGILTTKPKIIPYETLKLGMELIRTEFSKEFFNIIFIGYNDENKIPKNLYSTSLYIEKKFAVAIINDIRDHISAQSNENNPFFTISLN